MREIPFFQGDTITIYNNPSPSPLCGAEMNTIMEEWQDRQIIDALKYLRKFPDSPDVDADDLDAAEDGEGEDGGDGDDKDRTNGGEGEEIDDPIQRGLDLEGDIIFAHSGLSRVRGPVDLLRLPRGSLLELGGRYIQAI